MKKTLLGLSLLLLGAACSQRELPQQNTNTGPFLLEKHIIPEVVNPGRVYPVSVRLIGGAMVDSVRLDALSFSRTPLRTYWLFDDGGTLHADSGDQVAFDGYFSQNILWTSDSQAAEELIWRFEATTREGKTVEPMEVNVSSQKNSAPVLISVDIPDTLHSGFEGVIKFRAQADDSNGVVDIDQVKCSASQSGVAAFELSLPPENEPGVFEFALDNSFAVAKKGLYDLNFQAIDRSGALSSSVGRSLSIENRAPRLSDFMHADSVALPDAGMMTAFLITVRVQDDQSAADIKSVMLEWKKPDGTFSKNSPFTLYDNGLPWNEDFTGWDDGWRGDATAGDGVYSITGIFDPNQPLGDYQLTFYAEDFAGNFSDHVTRIVTLYPKAAGLFKTNPALQITRAAERQPFEGN
jgi:hypothetical protein